MKTIEIGKPIEIDEETDDLLQRIADSEVPDLPLLQQALPDAFDLNQFLGLLGLVDAKATISIANQLQREDLTATGSALDQAVENAKKLKMELEASGRIPVIEKSGEASRQDSLREATQSQLLAALRTMMTRD